MATKNTNAPIVNDTLIDWVIKEEGFLDKPTNIGDGKITLGSGLTAQKWRDKYRKNGNKWTKQDNRAAVREELESRKRWAEDTIPNWENLPDDTKRAMLSYKYNYDFDAKNSPKLFSAMKSGDYIEAVRQMDATSKDPKFKKGLKERRNREQAWGLGALIGSNAPIYQEAPTIVEYPDNTRVFNPYTPLFEEAIAKPALVPATPTTNYVEARQAEPEEWQQDDALAAFRMLERAKNYRDSMLWENQPELPQREYNPTEAPYLVTRYDGGGKVDVSTRPYIVSPVTTSRTPLDITRKKLYDNIQPWGYNDVLKRAFNAVIRNKKEPYDDNNYYRQRALRDDLWATYLQIPENERHDIKDKVVLEKSPYKPKGAVDGKEIYRFKHGLSEAAKHGILSYAGQLSGSLNVEGLPYLPENTNRVVYPKDINMFSELEGLGQFTVGRGRDNKGEYVSFYDSWDLGDTNDPYQDQTYGIGKPFSIYDRIYLDDYYETPEGERGAHYLPEITVRANKKAEGGDLEKKKTWDELSVKEKADMMRVAVENGITSLSEIKDKYNEFAENADIEETVENVNKSTADFVNRLKDADRQYIKDWASDGIATHKLGVGTDSKGNNYIYPEVQNIDGELVDFTRPPYLPYAGMISAEERGDTVRVPSIEQGVRFTENYKKYYPKGKTFAEGGNIYKGLMKDS